MPNYATGVGGLPDWGNARLFSGTRAPEDLVAPQLRAWAAKKGKEEAEIQQARSKMREVSCGPPQDGALAAGAGASADGALPGGG